MPASTAPAPLISPTEMKVIERVLNLQTGYVLDFSNRTFDEFIAHEVGIDATAPRYSEDGTSKARRLRRILHSLPAPLQAKLLRALGKHRDSPISAGQVDLLDDEWRRAYDEIIQRLEGIDPPQPQRLAASSWTGRRTLREQVAVVRAVTPLASVELERLADLVEEKRFNDPITADAIKCLRELHAQLGELIAAVDRGSMTREAVAAIEANRQKLIGLLREGAKVTVVAPAMTFGVMHLLSWLSGVAIDSTMVAGVFAGILGADALKSIGKTTSLATQPPPA